MSALEALVNAWMETDHPRIRHACQSMRGEHILLSFVYEETHELEKRVAAQAQVSPVSRFFDDEFPAEEHPTSPRLPVTPPPAH